MTRESCDKILIGDMIVFDWKTTPTIVINITYIGTKRSTQKLITFIVFDPIQGIREISMIGNELVSLVGRI